MQGETGQNDILEIGIIVAAEVLVVEAEKGTQHVLTEFQGMKTAIGKAAPAFRRNARQP